MKSLISVVVTLGCLMVCQVTVSVAYAQDGTVTARLSSNTITRDDTVTLTITAVGIEGEPDTSALNQSFDIVGQSTSREIRTVTGTGQKLKTTSIVNWALELMPKGMGVFTVPAVTINGVSSQLMTLTVNDLPTGASRDVFVEMSVDTKTPYVQSQVLMTLKVYHAIEIVDGGLGQPAAENLVVQRLGEDNVVQEVRDGRGYRVFTRQLALFAQKSGPMVIPPITLSVSVPADPRRARGFFAPTRKISRRTDPLTLEVQARPPGGRAWWLPAKAVQIEGQWSGDINVVEVDQPLTRTITVRASGVMDAQLPEIKLPAIDGVSLYAEQPERAMGMNSDGLVASQNLNWALIPQRTGELTLPAIELEWFNTETGKSEVAVLPAETINVQAAGSQTKEAQAINPNASGANIAGADQAGGANEGTGASASADELVSAGSSDSAQDGSTGSIAGANVNDAASKIASLGANDTVESSSSENEPNIVQPSIRTSDAEGDSSGAGASSSLDDGQAENTDALAGGPSAQATEPDMLSEQLVPLANRVRELQGRVENWRLVALAGLILWLLSLGVFFWLFRRVTLNSRPTESRWTRAAVGINGNLSSKSAQGSVKITSLGPLEASCKSNEPAAVRQALLEWSARQWPDDAPLTLTALRERLPQGGASHCIKTLDAALYGRQTGSDSVALTSMLKKLSGDLKSALKGQLTSSTGSIKTVADLSAGDVQTGRGLPEL